MFFNTVDFAIFLPIVFGIYWLTQDLELKWRNTVLFLASYFFYGWWDWYYLGIISISILCDFFIGQRIHDSDDSKIRKRLLWLSIGINLSMLGFFKYFNFFVDSFVSAFQMAGGEINMRSINIILPIGISFYTFQSLSYTIDIYRKQLMPSKNLLSFATFVSFFPQLVAGPIERASHLLPQFSKSKKFDYNQGVDGSRQILWGMFKKVVIADNCAIFVNNIYAQSDELSGITLAIGAIFFVFQIYGDFSGYSDIGIGTAKLFGFDLRQNFAFPLFSRNFGEFWRRWHISLNTWFRDYLYIPLGGNKYKSTRNIFIIFLISGFWHGANWTYIIWGVLSGLFFIPSFLNKKNRKYRDTVAERKYWPSLRELKSIVVTNLLITFTWIIFRSESMTQAITFISNMLVLDFFDASIIPPNTNLFKYIVSVGFVVFLIGFEWTQRTKLHGLQLVNNKISNWVLYLFITCSIFIYGGGRQDFVYFQF